MNQVLVGFLYRPFVLVRVSSWIVVLYGKQETITNSHETNSLHRSRLGLERSERDYEKEINHRDAGL